MQQAAAMLGHTENTLREHYAVNSRAGMAQAGVQAMAQLMAQVQRQPEQQQPEQQQPEQEDEEGPEAKKRKCVVC